MEKDIDKIQKNADTDIVIRIDDFGGKRGVTIREFVKSDNFQGFTKAGTRIPADKFKIFKAAINSINEKDLEGTPDYSPAPAKAAPAAPKQQTFAKPAEKKEAKPSPKIEDDDAEVEEIEEQEF